MTSRAASPARRARNAAFVGLGVAFVLLVLLKVVLMTRMAGLPADGRESLEVLGLPIFSAVKATGETSMSMGAGAALVLTAPPLALAAWAAAGARRRVHAAQAWAAR